MLDPEQLTFAQWFWIVFGMVVGIMFICRWIDINFDVGPMDYLSPYLLKNVYLH